MRCSQLSTTSSALRVASQTETTRETDRASGSESPNASATAAGRCDGSRSWASGTNQTPWRKLSRDLPRRPRWRGSSFPPRPARRTSRAGCARRAAAPTCNSASRPIRRASAAGRFTTDSAHRRPAIERRSLPQDGLLELSQRRRRSQAELVAKSPPVLLVRGERVGRPPGTVEGLHELAAWTLAERIRRDPGDELRHESGAFPRVEALLNPLLQSRGAQLDELSRFGIRPALVGELRVRHAPPQRRAHRRTAAPAPCAETGPHRRRLSPISSRYPRGSVTRATPTSLRSFETRNCNAFLGSAGSPPRHRSSIRRSAATIRPGAAARRASSARSPAARTGTTHPSTSNSNGPSTRISTVHVSFTRSLRRIGDSVVHGAGRHVAALERPREPCDAWSRLVDGPRWAPRRAGLGPPGRPGGNRATGGALLSLRCGRPSRRVGREAEEPWQVRGRQPDAPGRCSRPRSRSRSCRRLRTGTSHAARPARQASATPTSRSTATAATTSRTTTSTSRYDPDDRRSSASPRSPAARDPGPVALRPRLRRPDACARRPRRRPARQVDARRRRARSSRRARAAARPPTSRSVIRYDGAPRPIDVGARGRRRLLPTERRRRSSPASRTSPRPGSRSTTTRADKATYTFRVTVPPALRPSRTATSSSVDEPRRADDLDAGMRRSRWRPTSPRRPSATSTSRRTGGRAPLLGRDRPGLLRAGRHAARPAPSYAIIRHGRLRRTSGWPRTIDVPAGGATLSFWVNRDTEPDWDFFFVEAHTSGQDDWTTLPDAQRPHARRTPAAPARSWLAAPPVPGPLPDRQRATDLHPDRARPARGTPRPARATATSTGRSTCAPTRAAASRSSLTYASDDVVQLQRRLRRRHRRLDRRRARRRSRTTATPLDGWTVPGRAGRQPGEHDRLDRRHRRADAPVAGDRSPRRRSPGSPRSSTSSPRDFGPYPFSAVGRHRRRRPTDSGSRWRTRPGPIYAREFFADPVDGRHRRRPRARPPVVRRQPSRSSAGSDIWLNEGFATYAEWLWSEHEGLGTAAGELRRLLQRHPGRQRPVLAARDRRPGPDAAVRRRRSTTAAR